MTASDGGSSSSRRSSIFAPNAYSTDSPRGGSPEIGPGDREHTCSLAGRSVEFRQAAATLDPDSVVAWVRVVVNLTCAAVHSRMEEFSRLVHCCAKAEREPQWYDAFDLLVDLGMPRTAQFIQTRMLSRQTRSPWADLPAKEAPKKDATVESATERYERRQEEIRRESRSCETNTE